METVLILVLSFVGLLGLTLILLLIMEVIRFRRVGVFAHFIYKDNTIKRKKYKNIKDTIDYDDLPYEYDEKRSFHFGRKKHIYYLYGNPTPIEVGVANSGEFSTEDFKNILRSDIIKKLFSEDDKMSKDTKTILIVMVLGLLAVLFATYHFGTQLSLLSPDNAELVKSWVAEAIKGV